MTLISFQNCCDLKKCIYLNDFVGRLPEALYLLSHLQYLDLSNNRLSGSLPMEFQKLLSLRDLWLDRNNFGSNVRKADVQVLLPQCRIRI